MATNSLNYMPVARNIPILKWFHALSNTSLYGAIAIIYFAGITHSYALAMLVFGIQTISSAIFEVPTGVLSDLFGRKYVLILAQLCAVLSLTLYAFGGTFELLALGGVLAGLGMALESGNNDALLYDTMKELGTEESYTDVNGKMGSIIQFSLSAGVLIGSLVVGLSLSLAFQLTLIPQILALLLVFGLKEPRIHEKKVSSNIFSHLGEAVRIFFSNKRLALLSIAQIIENTLWTLKYQFLPAFLGTLMPLWAVSVLRSTSHASSAMGWRYAGIFIKKYTPEKVLLWSESLAWAIGGAVILFANALTPVLYPTSVFFVGMAAVTQGGLLQKEFTDEHRATLASFNSLITALLTAATGYSFGLFADTIGPQYALLSLQGFFIFVIAIYWKLFRKNPPTPPLSL